MSKQEKSPALFNKGKIRGIGDSVKDFCVLDEAIEFAMKKREQVFKELSVQNMKRLNKAVKQAKPDLNNEESINLTINIVDKMVGLKKDEFLVLLNNLGLENENEEQLEDDREQNSYDEDNVSTDENNNY